MGDREQQRKFAQNSNIKNSEYDRQNTNVIGRTNAENKGNILPTDIENQKSPQTNILLVNIISVVLGVGFFIFIIPISKYFLRKDFYSGSLFLLISLVITILFVYLMIFVGNRIFRINY